MRTFVSVICGMMLLWSACAGAQTTPHSTISWTANREPDIAGYRVYQSLTSNIYGTGPVYLLQSTATSVTVSLPQNRCSIRYFWTVTAFDFAGQESVKSVEVSKTIVGTQFWIGACKK